MSVVSVHSNDPDFWDQFFCWLGTIARTDSTNMPVVVTHSDENGQVLSSLMKESTRMMAGVEPPSFKSQTNPSSN